MALEILLKGETFLYITMLEIRYGLGADSNLLDVVFRTCSSDVLFFENYFRTACPNDANDIALERY